MKTLILLLATILIGGCATGLGYQGMSADQIAALAKMKDANIQCIKGNTPMAGSFLIVMVNLDKGVIPEGGITASPDCAVTLTNSRVITTTTVTTTPQPTQK